MRLYGYFRSSAAYRVRIALNLKGVAVEHVPVHLLKDGGQQKLPTHLLRNPQALVPVLELDDGTLLTQSLAIIEYLDATFPCPHLIPEDPVLAARVRAVALAISGWLAGAAGGWLCRQPCQVARGVAAAPSWAARAEWAEDARPNRAAESRAYRLWRARVCATRSDRRRGPCRQSQRTGPWWAAAPEWPLSLSWQPLLPLLLLLLLLRAARPESAAAGACMAIC